MTFCVDLVSEDSFYENITLGITKLLGKLQQNKHSIFMLYLFDYLHFI